MDRRADADITETLIALRNRAPDAMDRLMPLVYDQLRQVAHHQLGAEETGHTLTTTALVHETYLKLVDQTRVDWQDRAHFFAVASLFSQKNNGSVCPTVHDPQRLHFRAHAFELRT